MNIRDVDPTISPLTTKMLFQILLLSLVSFSSADEIVPAVIGGRNAYSGEFPHQVSLQNGWTQNHFCGGTLIHPQWVLTAAHCATGGAITVKAGKNNIRLRENTEQSAAVQRVIVHEWYRGEVGPYDIALLKLNRPFQLNNYVKTIALPQQNSEPTGNAGLSGWGSTSSSLQPSMPSILQTVTLPLIDAYNCKERFRPVDYKMYNAVHQTNICTIAGAYGISACSGDSGGPLIKHNSQGVLEIIGIVSWGSIPCGSRTPSVYTKVSVFVDWIRSRMAVDQYISN